MRCPDSIPAGTSTSQVRGFISRPRPRQTAQGDSGVFPAPPQVGQAPVRSICPNAVCGHLADLPGAVARLARVDRGAGLRSVSVAVLADRNGLQGDLAMRPGEHLVELTSTVAPMSAPAAGAGAPEPEEVTEDVVPPRPKSAEITSSKLPKSLGREWKPPERSPSWP